MVLRHRCVALASGLLLVAVIGHAQIEAADRPQPAGLQIQVLSCDPYAGQRDLRVARVRIRTGADPAELTDLQCGAFEPGTNRALFMNAVDGLGRLPAGAERIAQVVFPASARHRECRCVIGSAVTLRERRSARGPEWWEEETWEPAPRVRAEPGDWPPQDRVPDSNVLRPEVVLRPATELHREPNADTKVLERLTAQEHVDVLSIERGWKQVRRRGGSEGWIRSDTATPDLEAPARVGARLDELALALLPDGTAPDALVTSCPISAADALPELVFALVPATHTVYVTNLWYALDDLQRDAFHAWVRGCHEITRIVELATGAELRNATNGDGVYD
ncbi:MAG: SH3 domain-containing protein [Deltaproteobacteria bacterium]|nr:SH3 domain-containing protein [Deltaproteobacteria bacterium]MBW2393765.1 SH3 domain-containing protein [Deltaproteobacteria bacterium]